MLHPLTLANILLFKANNGNTSIMSEIISKLTIKTQEQRHWRRSGVFVVNFEQISHIANGVSISDFEQIHAGWEFFTNHYSSYSILKFNRWV